MSKLFVIETVSMFRMSYCVKANTQEEAEDIFRNSVEPKEFGQIHIGETEFGVCEVSTEKYIEQFDTMNDYIAHIDVERKLSYIMEKDSEG